jgi:competence protein ComEA
MDAAPPPTPASVPPAVLTAWPPSAQWATAFLLGVATSLLAVQGFGHLRWGSRPTEWERGDGLAYRIDLNRAGRPELLQIPGVGESLAQRIEDRRREHGPFRSVDELTEVRGVGPATLARVRPWVRVDAAAADDATEPPPRAAPRTRTATNSESPRAPSKKEANLKQPIDINRAGVEELQRLPGIGPKLSQRIVDERGKGPFKTVDDLRRVSGIGPKTLERLRPHVTVGDALVQGS